MKQRLTHFYSLFLICCMLGVSCKEEKVYPTITIERPATGSSYAFGDTIYVTATVENATDFVRINVLRGDVIVEFGTNLIDREGNTYHWQLYYTNKYLSGGTYDIRVSGSNAGNNNSDFQQITLKPYPLEFRGLSFLGSSNQGSIIGRMDSIGNVLTYVNNESFHFLANRSEFRQIIVAPKTAGELIAHEFTDLEIEYTKPNLNLPDNRQYRQFYVFDRKTYALLNDGRILSLSENGSTELIISLAEPFIPILAEMTDRGLLVAVKEGTLNLYHLMLLNRQTGAILRRITLTAKPIALSSAGNNRVFIVYYKDGEGVAAEYNFTGNTVTERVFITGIFPNDILIAGGMGYVASSDGIYAFSPDQPAIINQLMNLPASLLEYEQVNKEVYFSSGAAIYKFPIGGNQHQFVYFGNDSIVDFDLMFNK